VRNGEVQVCCLVINCLTHSRIAGAEREIVPFVQQKGLCTKKAEFRYYEFQKVKSNGITTRRRVDGTFVEDIEMDVQNGAYERISVPPILESRRSTVLHDFEMVNLITVARAFVSVLLAVCVHWVSADKSLLK